MAIAGWECMSGSLWKSDISLKHLHNVYYRRRNGWEVLLTDSHVGRRSRQHWQALGLFMYHAQARPKWRARREVAWGLGYGWHARTIMHTRLQDMWGAQPPLRNRCLCHATSTRSAQVCMGNTPNTHLLDAGETIAYRFRPDCLSPRNDITTKYTIWVLYFEQFVLRSVLWLDRTYGDLG